MLIILLMLTFTGVITLGDIFGFIFGVMLLILLVVLIGGIVMRYRINKARREAEARGEEFTGYTWHFGSRTRTSGAQGSQQATPEGRVRVSRTEAPKQKKVSKNVGEYVDFEEE